MACWSERRIPDWKVESSNPGIFFFRINFVCWLLVGVRSTPVVPQWHVKDPGHSAKSAGGRLHLNAHTSLTKWSRSGLTMPVSRHSVETHQETSSHASRNRNTRSQLSQLTEPLSTDPGQKSGISMHELISTVKKKKEEKKKCRQGMNCQTFSQNPHTQRKSYHHEGQMKLHQAHIEQDQALLSSQPEYTCCRLAWTLVWGL